MRIEPNYEAYKHVELAKVIHERFLSNRRFAKFMGCSATAIGLVLKGKISISLANAIAWLDALNLPRTEIFKYFNIETKEGE